MQLPAASYPARVAQGQRPQLICKSLGCSYQIPRRESAPLTATFEVPFLVLRGQTPTFEDLAQEAAALVRHPDPSQLPYADQETYRRALPKLRAAAKWSFATDWSLAHFVLQIGVLRYGVILGVGALAIVLLQHVIGPDDRAGSVTVLIVLLSLGFGAGAILSALRWQGVMDCLHWAQEYRADRMRYEELLRSPDGLQGWRLVDNTDGSCSLLRSAPKD